jgi:putative transposase
MISLWRIQPLNVAWHQLESFVQYKSIAANKAVFKVSPHQTSQECAQCGHTHPGNRKTQSIFSCLSCGHTDNADRNAARVIKKRAIALIKHSGTELVGAKTSILKLANGRGGHGKTCAANANHAQTREPPKKNGLAAEFAAA